MRFSRKMLIVILILFLFGLVSKFIVESEGFNNQANLKIERSL